MKLDLTNLAEYEKLVMISSPRTGMRKKDSLYFDFDKSKIFIHSDFMVAYINFSFEALPDEEYKNLFFDTQKLFIILNNFNKEEVNLIFEKKNGTLTPKFIKDQDNFTIEHLLESEEDFSIVFSENSIEFLINDFLSKTIKEAYQFVDQTKDNQFNSIAINNTGIYGVTPARFYQYKTNVFSSQVEDKTLIIHRDVAKFISSLKEECRCFYSEGKIKFVLDNIFEFVFAIPYTHTTIPSETDIENVVSTNNRILLSTNELLTNIKFFDPFYSLDSKPIRIKILSETELELSIVSDFDTIKKIIPIIEGNSSLIGFEAEYNGDIIKLALSILSSEVNLYFDFEKIGMVISEKDYLIKSVAVMKYI